MPCASSVRSARKSSMEAEIIRCRTGRDTRRITPSPIACSSSAKVGSQPVSRCSRTRAATLGYFSSKRSICCRSSAVYSSGRAIMTARSFSARVPGPSRMRCLRAWILVTHRPPYPAAAPPWRGRLRRSSFADVHHRSGLLHRKAQPVPAEQLHSDCAQSCAQLVVFVHRLPPAETRFSFPVSIVVRKPMRFKRFPALSTFLPIGHRFFRHIAHTLKP